MNFFRQYLALALSCSFILVGGCEIIDEAGEWSDGDSYHIIYSGKNSTASFYLVVSKAQAGDSRPVYTPSAGDNYILNIAKDEDWLRGSGTVVSIVDAVYTLRPAYEAADTAGADTAGTAAAGTADFTVATEGESIAAITGNITLDSGETVSAPGKLGPQEYIPGQPLIVDMPDVDPSPLVKALASLEKNDISHPYKIKFTNISGIQDKIVYMAALINAYGRYVSLDFSECLGEEDAAKTIGQALKSYKYIKEAVLPGFLTCIGDSAFEGCAYLTGITIPASVTTIGALGFSNCSSLTEISIPESVEALGEGAFAGCGSLVSVTFAGRCTIFDEDFGENAFPQGEEAGDALKAAYLSYLPNGGGTYTREENGEEWVKESALDSHAENE